MKHSLKIQASSFEKIKNESLNIDFRIFTPKLQKLQTGDFVEFVKRPDFKEKVLVRVNLIYTSDTFKHLFKDLGMSKEEVKEKNELMHIFFPRDKEKQYGVIGIVFSKIYFSSNY